MQSDHSSIHQTEINRIQNAEESGWEFVCHSCGYRARYTINQQGAQKLEIIVVGDSSARHSTGIPPESAMDPQGFPAVFDPVEANRTASSSNLQTPPDDAGFEPEDDLTGDIWLPVDIQEQVEAILQKYE
jgi:hypothetical protein